ncbi:MAG: hypothetical protein BMS9Abin12_1999 [Acidimicrobiia bacterium]|nr:MAG: hypothetical protein BMS9Abin12_1999 [Acidimicrobiia bacterium]
MARLPISIGSIALSAAFVGATAFAAQPGNFDRGAAVVVLAGTIVVGLTGFVGLALVGAPWGRWTLLGIVVAGLIFASIPGSWPFLVTLVLGGVAAIGLMGPWLRLWVRRRPAADAPNAVVVALMAVGPASPLYIGLTSLEGLDPTHLVLIAVTMASSWAYGRGLHFGIWGLRIVVPIAGALATASTTGIGRVALGVAVIAVTILSWMPHARRATAVITLPLRAPSKHPTGDTPDASE